MEVSFIGLAVVAVLVAASALLGPPLLVASIASFAFGATAIGTLGALGGASPQIYLVPGGALIVAMILRRRTLREVEIVLMRDMTGWAVLLIGVYATASALILPRLFAGVTTAFVASRTFGVVEVPLAPTAGNLSQTAYLIFGTLSFATVSVVLLRPSAIGAVTRGFFLWAFLMAATGVIDRLGKLAGAGDVLAPIRTASYAMLTSSELSIGNVTRISGAFSEASGFGGSALAAFVFSFAYWRRTGTPGALALAVVLLVLVLLSTSSTAYVGLAVLVLVQLVLLVRAGLRGRLVRRDLVILGFMVVGGVAVLACLVANPSLFDPVVELFRSTILQKSDSQSGRERGYWNSRSLEVLLETGGLGIGMGSSRASSWVIAVLSQLGLFGALLMAVLVVSLLLPGPPVAPGPAARRIAGLHDGARLGALTLLLVQSIAGGQADPGSLFFIALATVLGCRAHLRAARPPLPARESRPAGRPAPAHAPGMRPSSMRPQC